MKTFAIILITTISISISPSITNAQNSDVIELLDSLYWEKEFEQVITIAYGKLESENDLYTEVGLNYYLANATYRTNNFTKALLLTEQNYTRSLGLTLKDSAEVKMAIDACQKLGDYSFGAEKLEQGTEALMRGISINEKRLDNDNWRLVKLYHKLGALLRVNYEFETAKEKLAYGQDVIIPKLSELQKSRIIPVYQAEVAEIYNECNQPQKAIEIYKEMIHVAEEQNNIARISIYNNNCGLAYARLRDFSKAKYHFLKNLEAVQKWKGPKSASLISSFTNLAMINSKMKLDKEALQYFKKTEDLIIEVLGKDNLRLSDVYLTTGSFHLNHADYQNALAFFRKSLEIRSINGASDDLKYSDAQQLIGKTLVMSGKIDEGITSLKKSANNRARVNLVQDAELSNTYAILYDAYMQKEEPKEAHKYLMQSFGCLKYNFEDPLAFEKIGIPNSLIGPLWRQIDYYTRNMHTSITAIKDGQKTIQISEELIQYLKYNLDEISSRQILANDVKPLNNAIVDFYFEAYMTEKNTNHIENAFATIEKSNNIFLYESLAEDSKDAYKLPIEIIELRRAILNTISNKQSKISESSLNKQNYNLNLADLNKSKEDLYTLIEEIKSEHPEYYETIYNFPITDIKTTQKQLSEEDVFVTYYFSAEYLYAITIDNHKSDFLKLAKSDEAKESIQNFIASLKQKNSLTEINATSSLLHESLIATPKLEKYDRILVSCDNILGLLPFEILGKGNDLYTMDYTIAYQYSATLMNSIKKSFKSGHGTIAMAPVFDKNNNNSSPTHFADVIRGVNNSNLPETENEVYTVARLFDGISITRSDATKEKFKSIAHGKRILHLATHGYADQENPNKSCLYFAQTDSTEESGQLFAEDIAQMNINANLVTLSACNTGSGKVQNGEGIASLGRSFAYAGCPNQVISLWSVNDKTTTELMTYFYTNLKEGQPKATALKNAKSQYLASAPEILKHPYYWAGFVYYGSDTTLDQTLNLGGYSILGLSCLSILLLGLFFRNKRSFN